MAFADWVGAKDEAWRRLADAQHVEAMDEDTGELVDIKPVQDDPNDVEGLLIRFGYTDASGNGAVELFCAVAAGLPTKFYTSEAFARSAKR